MRIYKREEEGKKARMWVFGVSAGQARKWQSDSKQTEMKNHQEGRKKNGERDDGTYYKV